MTSNAPTTPVAFVENLGTGAITVTTAGPNDFIELTPANGIVTGAADGPLQFIELTPATGIVTAVGAAPDAAQTTAFLSRTAGLSTNETLAYRNLINGIVSDGDWSSLIGLYALATKDTTTAALNLIGNNNNLTTHGTPASFVVDKGYTGDHSTFYLDTGYVPSVSGDISSFGVYKPNSDVTVNAWADIGCSTSAVAYSYFGGANPNLNFEMGGTSFPAASNSDAQGAWSVLRSGATVNVYKNNVATPVAVASDPLTGTPAASLILFGFLDTASGPSDLSGALLSLAWFGNASAAGIIRLHNRFNAFIATVNPGLNLWVPAVSDAITLTLPPFMYNSNSPTKEIASDTFSSTTGSDGNIYVSNDDVDTQWQGAGGGANMEISMLSGFTTGLTGSLVNPMTAFGGFATPGSDGNTFKIYGLISVNGVLYASTTRQAQTPNGSGQYPAVNSQIIKSSDLGVTWTPQPPSTANPFTSPMFTHPAPVFVQYEGADYQGNTVENSNLYVYATITDVGWNNNSNLYLMRCLISAIGNLSASDWSYYKGAPGVDITSSSNWDSSRTNAIAILTSTKKLGITGIQHADGEYVMMQWYYPSVANGNAMDFTSTVWTLYKSTGLTSIGASGSAKQTIFWPLTGLYDARVIPKSISGNTLTFAAAGNFSDTSPTTGQYTLQLIPATVT